MSDRVQRGIVLVAAVVAVLGTARLGVWQLSRASQKTALAQAIEQRGLLAPLPVIALARTPEQAQAQWHRRVALRGRWLDERTVFLDNRQMDGRPGFYVVTPLLLAPDDAVLVQRGWLAVDPADRSRLPPVPAGAGEVAVAGRIAASPSRQYELGESSAGRIRQNLDVTAFAQEIGVTLRPLAVVQTEPADEPDGLLRHWPAVAVDVAKHHGYAFQWFALSALIAGLYVWFQILRPRHVRST